jgi:L-ascorbate metabolism protein UlaG (beta-lactamase superfamily)
MNQNYTLKSDHYDGARFYNENPKARKHKSLYEVAKWKWQTKPKEEEIELAQNISNPDLATTIQSQEVFVTFINHATTLIQLEGLTILTDPVFSDYVGINSLLSVKRSQKAGMDFKDIPKVDLVLISHNHYDHLDLPSIKKIFKRDNPLFIVPLKNGVFLKEIGIEKIVELDWWDFYVLNEKQTVTLTPAQHWSGRGIFDRSKSLWGGFIIQHKNMKVFFAGDTGYASHFREIFHRFGAMDVSLLPIGCYKPRWFMKEQHMDPEEAVNAHIDLHSSYSIGIHFGSFKLADEGINQPVVALKKALKNKEISYSLFCAPLNGQTLQHVKIMSFLEK